jgi:ankyrin repeat protein
MSIVRGHADVVVALISAGASLEFCGGPAALLATLYARQRVLDVLSQVAQSRGEPLGAGEALMAASVDPGRSTARTGVDDVFGGITRSDFPNLALIEHLARLGVDPDERDPSGRTALYAAIQEQPEPPVIEALLHAGADPGLAGPEGRQPLHLAAAQMDATLIDLLLAAGASGDGVDDDGLTPLHYAAGRFGGARECALTRQEWSDAYVPALRSLIEAASDIDKPAANGSTALQSAVRRGLLRTAGVLIGSGADKTVPCLTLGGGAADDTVADCLHAAEREDQWKKYADWPVEFTDVRSAAH